MSTASAGTAARTYSPLPFAPPVSRDLPRFRQHVGVVTHVPHWEGGADGPIAYEPYVREIRIWGQLFEHVTVCAPAAVGEVAGNHAPYAMANLTWRRVEYRMEISRLAQLTRLAQLPALTLAIARLAREVDVLHLRGPGHPALIGRVVANALGIGHITKWAGFFGGFDGERLPTRLERHLTARDRWPVMVYGEAPAPHMISFFPALMTREEQVRADTLAAERRWTPPWRLLAVGRLLDLKGFDLAIRGLGELRRREPDIHWEFTLVGSGPEERALRALCVAEGISDRVTMTGALPFPETQRHFAAAHVVIMPGTQEGWPKPIPEAWAHGAVPVGAAAGVVPWILGGRGAGSTFEPTPAALAECLARLLADPSALPAAGARGREIAEGLSLEAFGARVAAVLTERLGVS